MEITFDELKQLIMGTNEPREIASVNGSFFIVGNKYLVRTVTMTVVGELVGINKQELHFRNASWVADTGRFHDALKSGSLNEVEPFVSDVIVGRGSLIDATVWGHDLPTDQC